jgi:hypothetical protein
MAAEEVLREARAKVDMLARDERLSSSAPAWLEALGAEAAADDALDAVRATLSGSDCPRVWIVSEQHADMCFHREVTATSPRGAIEAALRDMPEFRVGLLHVFIQHTSASLSIDENADSDPYSNYQNLSS